MAGPWTLECDFPTDAIATNRWLYYGRRPMNAKRGFTLLNDNIVHSVELNWEEQYRTGGTLQLIANGKSLVHVFRFEESNKVQWKGDRLSLRLPAGKYQWRFGRLTGNKKCPFAECLLKMDEIVER